MNKSHKTQPLFQNSVDLANTLIKMKRTVLYCDLCGKCLQEVIHMVKYSYTIAAYSFSSFEKQFGKHKDISLTFRKHDCPLRSVISFYRAYKCRIIWITSQSLLSVEYRLYFVCQSFKLMNMQKVYDWSQSYVLFSLICLPFYSLKNYQINSCLYYWEKYYNFVKQNKTEYMENIFSVLFHWHLFSVVVEADGRWSAGCRCCSVRPWIPLEQIKHYFKKKSPPVRESIIIPYEKKSK